MFGGSYCLTFVVGDEGRFYGLSAVSDNYKRILYAIR